MCTPRAGDGFYTEYFIPFEYLRAVPIITAELHNYVISKYFHNYPMPITIIIISNKTRRNNVCNTD